MHLMKEKKQTNKNIIKYKITSISIEYILFRNNLYYTKYKIYLYIHLERSKN